jgi:hypothetical protein
MRATEKKTFKCIKAYPGTAIGATIEIERGQPYNEAFFLPEYWKEEKEEGWIINYLNRMGQYESMKARVHEGYVIVDAGGVEYWFDENDLATYAWENIYSISFGCEGQFKVRHSELQQALTKLREK